MKIALWILAGLLSYFVAGFIAATIVYYLNPPDHQEENKEIWLVIGTWPASLVFFTIVPPLEYIGRLIPKMVKLIAGR